MISDKENKDLSTIDIPNLFIQILMYRKPGEDKIIMKIRAILVDILVQMYRGKYDANVVYEKVKKLLYLDSLKAIYFMLQSALVKICPVTRRWAVQPLDWRRWY